MAEVTIDGNVSTIMHGAVKHGVVQTAPDVIYVFVVNSDSDADYYKSVDGGTIWAGPTALNGSDNMVCIDVCHDIENGGSGTKIHIAMLNNSNNDAEYRFLDTVDDSLGAIRTVFTGASTSADENWDDHDISICKSISGKLYMAGRLDQDGESFFAVSDSGGVDDDWTAKANPYSIIATEQDLLVLMPGNEADTDDIWAIFFDDSDSDNVKRRKYDRTADSWDAGANYVALAGKDLRHFPFDAIHRKSDDETRVAIWNHFDNAIADLKFFSDDGTTITALNDIVSNQDDTAGISLMINQQDDNEIWAAYYGAPADTINSSVHIRWRKTTDDAATAWGAETQLSTTKDDHRWVGAGRAVGDLGGQFRPAWYNDDLADVLIDDAGGEEIAAAVPEPPAPAAANLPEYGQVRTAIGDPAVFGATILRS